MTPRLPPIRTTVSLSLAEADILVEKTLTAIDAVGPCSCERCDLDVDRDRLRTDRALLVRIARERERLAAPEYEGGPRSHRGAAFLDDLVRALSRNIRMTARLYEESGP